MVSVVKKARIRKVHLFASGGQYHFLVDRVTNFGFGGLDEAKRPFDSRWEAEQWAVSNGYQIVH